MVTTTAAPYRQFSAGLQYGFGALSGRFVVKSMQRWSCMKTDGCLGLVRVCDADTYLRCGPAIQALSKAGHLIGRFTD